MVSRNARSGVAMTTAGSDITIDNIDSIRNIVEIALGQHRSFMQAGDLDAECAHKGHIVLYDDHGACLGYLFQQLGGGFGLGVGHAGDGLVDQAVFGAAPSGASTNGREPAPVADTAEARPPHA